MYIMIYIDVSLGEISQSPDIDARGEVSNIMYNGDPLTHTQSYSCLCAHKNTVAKKSSREVLSKIW